MNETNAKNANTRAYLPQIFAVSVKNTLLICFGMVLGFPTILLADLETSNDNGNDNKILQTTQKLSWIETINLIFVPMGCLCSGPLCEKFGRKRTMQMIIVSLIGIWSLLSFSFDWWTIYVCLAFFAILHGLIESPVITYVAEITLSNLRGTLTSTSVSCIIGGVLLEYILGAFFTWPTVGFVNRMMAILSFCLLYSIPESPLWLVNNRKNAEAKQALVWLRSCHKNPQHVNREFHEMLLRNNNNVNNESPKNSLFAKLKQGSFYKPYFLVSSVFFVQHFSGTSYCGEIFEELETPFNKYTVSVIFVSAEALGAFTCTCLISTMGKRKLTFTSMFLSMISLLFAIVYSFVDLDEYKWIPLAFILSYTYFAHVGLRVLPWILLGEVFPNEIRPFASGLSAATGYVFAFIANRLFFISKNTLTLPGLLMIYFTVIFFGLLYLYFSLPETEGKSLSEICDFFNANTKTSIKHLTACSAVVKETLEDLYMQGVKCDHSYRKFSTVDNNSTTDV